MKLLTKIYLAFGFILLTFIFVTVIFIRNSKEVEKDTQEALRASEVQRLSEAQQKSLLDMVTGLRGYWISGNETMLEAYYNGKSEFLARRVQLDSIIQIEEQRQKLYQIDTIFQKWSSSFAEYSILLQQNALKSDTAKASYNNFKAKYINVGVGNGMVRQMRSIFNSFDRYESVVKNQRMEELDKSVFFTNALAVVLTALTTIIGVFIALLLGKTIKKRLLQMIDMAQTIAQGNFQVNIKDTRHDEISRLSDSLNIMASKLNTSFSELNKKNKELDQFAYVVSHDLKAPLRAINSLAEWLEEDIQDPDPEIKRNLGLMRGRALRLENLINGILQYSRIGRQQVTAEQVDVNLLLTDLLDSLSPDKKMQIHLQPNMPELYTEKILLEQVFANLIGNAIKYHDKPAGNVWVRWRNADNAIEFEVADDGPGIAPEFHERIFTIFQTIEARDTRESTGVGLAIVQKIIEEKGGKIRVESEVGKGSRFIFTWPTGKTLAEIHTEMHQLSNINS